MGPTMKERTAFQALEFGARSGGSSCGIVFFGGEPLLAKPLIRSIVARARAMERCGEGSFHFKITTNGLLLDEEFIEYADRQGLLIAMSLDGIKSANDRHRRLPDGSPSFEILRSRLRLLLRHRPYASVLMVVNPDTVSHLSDSVSFLIGEGCRYLIVSLNYAAPWGETDLLALASQYRRIGKLYVRWTREGRKFYLSPFEVKLSSHIHQGCFRKEKCELGERQLSVDPEGYLYPCVQFTRAGPESEWCIGNVWDGMDEEKKGKIRARSEREKEPCRECAIQDRCNNTCGCLNWQTTGAVTEVSPVLCRHEQMLVPIADRVGEILFRKRDPLFLQKHYNATYPLLSLLEDTVAGEMAPASHSGPGR